MDEHTCTHDGCERPPRSRQQELCKLHYQQAWKAQQGTCTIEGCDRPYMASGMCGMHYKRIRNGIPFSAPIQGSGKAAGCAVDECGNQYHANGYCGQHAQRHRRTGDPKGYRREPRATFCAIFDCDGRHFGLGYCQAHYTRLRQQGAAQDVRTCAHCGASFHRRIAKIGSYQFCEACQRKSFWYGAAIRRERVRANDAPLTASDKLEAAQYRQIILADPCVYCGGASEAVDHIHPVAQGGSSRWDNYAPICRPCNSSKSDRTLLTALLAIGASRARSAPSRQAA